MKPSRLFLAALISALHIPALASGPALTVHHDPYCGCCTAWIDYLREEGFSVNSIITPDMGSLKQKLGVPGQLASCHTAVVDGTGQLIEGHAPVSAINKLLQRPHVKGIAVPGMPINSPGMGRMDGTLVTVDFSGRPFSRD